MSALARRWEVTVASMAYRPVGFGSHHWEVIDAAGTRWFVTVDDLEARRHSLREPVNVALDRLRRSLAAARDLRDCGRTFVVAPVPTLDGEPLARTNDRFGVALYPFVEGQSFSWGEFSTPAHRHAVLDLVIAVHTAPSAVRRHAMTDDFAIPHRDELEAIFDPAGNVEDCGPYARPTTVLLVENAAPIQRLLARYDELVMESRAQPSRTVLTHGEPHLTPSELAVARRRDDRRRAVRDLLAAAVAASGAPRRGRASRPASAGTWRRCSGRRTGGVARLTGQRTTSSRAR